MRHLLYAITLLLLVALPAVGQQHIALLHSDGAAYVPCTSAGEAVWENSAIAPAWAVADLSGMAVATLTIHATSVVETPTYQLYYRPIGGTWSPSGISITIPASGRYRSDPGAIPAGMRGAVELGLWSEGTGGGAFLLSVAVVASE